MENQPNVYMDTLLERPNPDRYAKEALCQKLNDVRYVADLLSHVDTQTDIEPNTLAGIGYFIERSMDKALDLAEKLENASEAQLNG